MIEDSLIGVAGAGLMAWLQMAFSRPEQTACGRTLRKPTPYSYRPTQEASVWDDGSGSGSITLR
ncbi:MAG: hypothetical protein AB7U20_11530 [Planctomycetaceae bacterium]